MYHSKAFAEELCNKMEVGYGSPLHYYLLVFTFFSENNLKYCSELINRLILELYFISHVIQSIRKLFILQLMQSIQTTTC